MMKRLVPRMEAIAKVDWAKDMQKKLYYSIAKFVAGRKIRPKPLKRIIHNLSKKHCSKMEMKQKYFRIKFSYPDYGIFMGKQLIGEMKRKIPAKRGREVKFKKYSKYENVHHRKGCEKLTDNFCMEPKLIKPY